MNKEITYKFCIARSTGNFFFTYWNTSHSIVLLSPSSFPFWNPLLTHQHHTQRETFVSPIKGKSDDNLASNVGIDRLQELDFLAEVSLKFKGLWKAVASI